jgi:hypothetical protein
MSRPLIQINSLVREMNDEEYERYLEKVANAHPPLEGHDETPSADA